MITVIIRIFYNQTMQGSFFIFDDHFYTWHIMVFARDYNERNDY